MATPLRTFPANTIHHVFNRGVAKQDIAFDDTDFTRFIERLSFYQQQELPEKFSRIDYSLNERQDPLLFDVLNYCIMPNHFHLLVRSVSDQGVSTGISRLSNSYTKYFNTRYERVGPVFQGPFKSVLVTSDEQLLHVFRYIALNPFTSSLEQHIGSYPWNGYREYMQDQTLLCETSTICELLGSSNSIRSFVSNYGEFMRTSRTMTDLQLD